MCLPVPEIVSDFTFFFSLFISVFYVLFICPFMFNAYLAIVCYTVNGSIYCLSGLIYTTCFCSIFISKVHPINYILYSDSLWHIQSTGVKIHTVPSHFI